MQFTIQKKYLLQSIQAVSNAISSKVVNPILTGMKIEITNQKLTLTGSNSDITIQSIINSHEDINHQDTEEPIIEEIITDIIPGAIVLPVPHFPEIIKKLPESHVKITVDDQLKTTIQSGKAVFTLYGQDHEEYPHVQLQEYNDAIQLNTKELKSMIRQTVFAVSQMETRPILTGVQVAIKEDEITFTATDSHRLSLRTTGLTTHELEASEIVIPGKSLQELSKIIDHHEGHINMAILKNQVLFYTDHIYFLSRLLSGNYPDISRLIPDNSETTIQLNTKELIHTIERAALLSNREQNNVIRLETLENHTIEISGNSPEVGNVEEQLQVISIEGDPLKISFSSKYLLDSLKTMENEKVQISFTGAMRPFIITAPDNDQILQLILPVRTF